MGNQPSLQCPWEDSQLTLVLHSAMVCRDPLDAPLAGEVSREPTVYTLGLLFGSLNHRLLSQMMTYGAR